jgi:hypothetical protein
MARPGPAGPGSNGEAYIVAHLINEAVAPKGSGH